MDKGRELVLEKVPASLTFQSFYALPVPIGLSVTGVNAAVEYLERIGIKPKILLCSIEDHWRAWELLYGSTPEFKWMERIDFPNGQWCIGNFEHPLEFVGSNPI